MARKIKKIKIAGTCPYCGKQFQDIVKHRSNCPKRPKCNECNRDSDLHQIETIGIICRYCLDSQYGETVCQKCNGIVKSDEIQVKGRIFKKRLCPNCI